MENKDNNNDHNYQLIDNHEAMYELSRKKSHVDPEAAKASIAAVFESNQPEEYIEMGKNDLHEFEKQEYTMFSIIFEILKSSIPATMGLLFVFITETINIIIVGQHNIASLIAAIGIGTLYVNATGYIPGAGLLGGIDTLCSQAFGRNRFDMVGIHASIGRASVTLFFVLITIPLNFLSFRILNGIGIEAEVAEYASGFCHAMSISVFFALQFNSSIRYLQSMNIFVPGSIITLVTSFIHPFWCHFFVNILDLGIVGAGYSMGATQFTNFALISLYIFFSNPYPESWVFISEETLRVKNLYNYFRKAIPAAIMFSADYIGFEILTLMASFLGAIPMAANVCLFNYITVIFMLQIGLSMAATTLVGNSIGARNKKLALTYSHGSIILGLTIMLVTTLLTIIFRNQIPGLYTQDKEVGELFYDLIGIYVIFSIPDSVGVVLHGVIKGLGKQKWASIACLICLYPINITQAYLLAFHFKLGVMGLWYSQMITIFLMVGSYSVIYYFIDLDDVIHDIESINRSKASMIKEKILEDDDL